MLLTLLVFSKLNAIYVSDWFVNYFRLMYQDHSSLSKFNALSILTQSYLAISISSLHSAPWSAITAINLWMPVSLALE